MYISFVEEKEARCFASNSQWATRSETSRFHAHNIYISFVEEKEARCSASNSQWATRSETSRFHNLYGASATYFQGFNNNKKNCINTQLMYPLLCYSSTFPRRIKSTMQRKTIKPSKHSWMSVSKVIARLLWCCFSTLCDWF